jgi:hypothetical protein
MEVTRNVLVNIVRAVQKSSISAKFVEGLYTTFIQYLESQHITVTTEKLYDVMCVTCNNGTVRSTQYTYPNNIHIAGMLTYTILSNANTVQDVLKYIILLGADLDEDSTISDFVLELFCMLVRIAADES